MEPITMMQSATIAKLADALCKAQSAMKPAKKDAENPFFKSNYADLASVWEAVKEPLSNNGLSVAQMPMPGPDGVVRLRTVLMHTSGEWIGGDLDMRPVKNDPQSIGSCLTYARRYALSAITGVATEDDDANAATVPTSHNRPIVANKTAAKPPAQALQDAAQQLAGEPVDVTVEDTATPPFVWRMGKWKSAHIADIDTSYLQWFAENGKDGDHKEAARAELERRQNQVSLMGAESEEVA